MAKWSETGETKSGPKSAGVYVFMMIYAMRWSDINIINIFRCIPMVKDRADYECGVNNMRQWFSLPFIRSVTIGKHMLVFACARGSLALAGPDSWWLASAYLFGTLRISQKSNASKSTQTRSLFFPIFWFWTILTRGHMLFDCPLGLHWVYMPWHAFFGFPAMSEGAADMLKVDSMNQASPFFLSRCFCFFLFQCWSTQSKTL
jgi:hypothetical protein